MEGRHYAMMRLSILQEWDHGENGIPVCIVITLTIGKDRPEQIV